MPGLQLWLWDATNGKWIKAQCDTSGNLKVDLSNVDLDDLGDVSVASPTNNHFLYYDAASGLWKARALVDADIPAAIARDTEVTAAVAAEAAARAAAIAAIELDDLADVEVPSPADDDILYWDDANGAWKSKAPSAGAFTSGCRAYLSADQTIPTGTWTKLELDTEEYDGDGEFDTTNHKFVAGSAGIYCISVGAAIGGMADGNAVSMVIKKNGNYAYGYFNTILGGAATCAMSASDIMKLAASDYVELFIWHNNAAARDAPAYNYCNYMAIHRIE